MAAQQGLMTPKSSSGSEKPEEKKPKKTVNDYVDLIETVARVEYSRLPNHLIDYIEVVNIGAIAVHVLLTSNPDREYNVTYLSTAMKWAIRNELRYRYKWYSLKQVSMDSSQEEGKNGETSGKVDEGFEVDKPKAREAMYEAILSVDGMMEAENPHEIRDSAYTPEENSEIKEMAKVVRDVIAKLPDRERKVLEDRFFKNKKMREIGESLGISPSRTSRIVQAGLDKVKVELKRRGYNPEF
ncbi:MAG: sigma-70 family RNA polymerase sigma factor [Cyanobacteria bacterium P01_H01_bin.74]